MSAQFAKDHVSFFAPANMSAATRPATGTGVAKGLRAVVAWFQAAQRRRAVIDELSMLTDHELTDIGLTRGDIQNVFDPVFANARRLNAQG